MLVDEELTAAPVSTEAGGSYIIPSVYTLNDMRFRSTLMANNGTNTWHSITVLLSVATHGIPIDPW